jgi:hypothetical protein
MTSFRLAGPKRIGTAPCGTHRVHASDEVPGAQHASGATPRPPLLPLSTSLHSYLHPLSSTLASRRRRPPLEARAPAGSLQWRASRSMAAPLAEARAPAAPGGRPSASSRGGVQHAWRVAADRDEHGAAGTAP